MDKPMVSGNRRWCLGDDFRRARTSDLSPRLCARVSAENRSLGVRVQ